MFELTPFVRRQNILAYDPFRELENIGKEFFGGDTMRFRADIKDTGKAYELEAELPGFAREDIKIDVEGDYLTVSAERKQEKDEKDAKGNYIRRERYYGSFSRSFDISGVDAENIAASYKDGVLKLVMPKREAKLPSARRLEIQ
ncbi:MAG TPA: Hsp20/alpha crystallin family protein [Clostridia bacterium]|nr:Hsp20/alpha crystallin family protein [Clostridia bacterium]